MTILDDFWDEYREMLPNATFSLYGNGILTPPPPYRPIGDKVAETATGPKQSQMVAIKLPSTSPKYSPKPVKSP